MTLDSVPSRIMCHMQEVCHMGFCAKFNFVPIGHLLNMGFQYKLLCTEDFVPGANYVLHEILCNIKLAATLEFMARCKQIVSCKIL